MKNGRYFLWGLSPVVLLIFLTSFSENVAAQQQITALSPTPASPAPVSTSSEMVQVPAGEWKQMQDDMKKVQKQMAADKEKAAKKAEEEKEKKFKSPDTKLSARFFFDGAAASGNDTADLMSTPNGLVNGSQFRQIRLTWKGSMYNMIEYAASIDFGGSDYAIKDVYGGFYNLPCGVSFRAGHFKEPWSMEELMSTTDTPLMEKSFLNSTKSLVGGRNNGVMLHNWHVADRYTWAAGVFAASMTEKTLNCFDEKDNVALTTRLTWLPHYVQWCDGRETAWHIGAAYSYRKYDRVTGRPADHGTSLSFRPVCAIEPALMNTGNMTGLDSMNAFQIESALIYGSFLLEFEQAFLCMKDERCTAANGKPFVHAGFLQASYVLTGEGRKYKKDGGIIGGITPECPFVRVCTDEMSVFSGPGAWEIAYRISWADTGELASGYDPVVPTTYSSKNGFMLANTVGLNWYWNKNVRMMFNYSYVKADYDGVYDGLSAKEHVFATRFQVVF